MSGIFLQRPLDTMGGSCGGDEVSTSCPAEAAACRKKTRGSPGVLCFGCAVDLVTGEYTCSKEGVEARVVSGAPPRFVHPSSLDLVIDSNDRKCTNVTATLDGLSLVHERHGITLTSLGDEEKGLVRIHLPTLPLGPHALVVQVSCINEDEVVLTSKDVTMKWTVVDPRPTNTSIIGIDTTKETDVSFELAANKPGCSFQYSMDGGVAQSVVGAGSKDDNLAARIVTSGISPSPPWPRTSLNVIYQSSRGAGVVFRSTLRKIGGEAMELEEVVAGSVSRQGQLTLQNLVRGEEYELVVDVQSGQARMVERIVVGGGSGEVWKTQLWTSIDPVTARTDALFNFGCTGVGNGGSVKYEYILDDKEQPTSTTKTLLVLEDLNVGIHTLSVFCTENKDNDDDATTSSGDPLPLEFVWEVIGLASPSINEPHYLLYTIPTSTMSNVVTCPRSTLILTPTLTSSPLRVAPTAEPRMCRPSGRPRRRLSSPRS